MGCLRWGFLVMLMMLAWPSAAMTALSSWGGSGTGQGQFTGIGGIAFDSVGNVYVADGPISFLTTPTVGRIQKFTSTGAFITEWGSAGAGDGQFSHPFGVAADSSNRVYVADHTNQRVQRFDSNGGFQVAWDVGEDVTGIGISQAGSVYVTHAGNRVERYDIDGNPLGSWGGLGTGDGEFNFNGAGIVRSTPAVDAAGNVYVSDAGNDRIQKFDADGGFILKWGSPQFGSYDPITVAVGPDGSVYVPIGSQANNGLIQKYDGTGTLIGTFQLPPIGAAPHIAVDAQNNLLVGYLYTLYSIDQTTPEASLTSSTGLTLTGEAVTFDASASVVPFASISKFEWDLDGDGTFELDGGTNPILVSSFSGIGTFTPVVRVTAPSGKTATATGAAIEIRAAPPPGETGVSINNGAVFTNDPNVTLRVVWPAFAREARVSNDGGFVPTSVFPVSSSIPWTLQESGPERLPKTVYLRFDLTGSQTFADDIILDQTPPAVNSASASVRRSLATATASKASYTLKVKASDNVSGVERMQVTTNRRKPSSLKPFASTTRLTTAAKRAFVRVQDAAGNFSKWKSLKLRPAVAITKIWFDARGPDTRANRSLNREWVQLTNTTNKRKTLTGWKLRDAANRVYRFGKFTLAPRASVKIHTGTGKNTRRHRYWGQNNHIWNNKGDKATLKNKKGKRADRCAYNRNSKNPTLC